MSKTKKQIFAPLSAPFRFLGSLALGIFLLAVLLVLMAMGTFIEAEYGAAVAKFVVYAHPGFYALLALLALNLVVSIILRFPWRLRQISFLIAHVGILLLLFGCYRTWQHGEEAQLTLTEGTIGTVAVKPDRQQLELELIAHSAAEGFKPQFFPLHLGPFSWQDCQYAHWIKDRKKYQTFLWYAMKLADRTTEVRSNDVTIEILDYYANSTLESVPSFDVSILWQKARRNWETVRLDLKQQHPSMPGLSDSRGVSVSMSQGERVSFSLATSQDELTAFQKSRPQGGNHTGLWGEIVLYYGGQHYSVNVDSLLNLEGDQRVSVEDTGLQIGDVRFRERGLVIQFTLFTQGGERETSVLMPDNPEWNVQARRLGIFGSYWIDPQRIMRESVNQADNPMLKRLAEPRLDFMQSPNKKLYYRLWSGQKIVADGIVPESEGAKKPQFKIAQYQQDEAEIAAEIVIDRFEPQDVFGNRIVSAPVSKSRQNEQRLKLRTTCDGKEETFWIRSAAPTIVPLPPEQDQIRYIYGNKRTVSVQFNSEILDLGFGILLKKFEKQTEPGTRMPSHFSSLVDYVESIDSADSGKAFSRDLSKYRALPNGENILISMNRPGSFRGKGRGYRIYQSSYQGPFYPDQPRFHGLYDGTIFPWESRPRESIAMSALSVNADPGRSWKYFGSFLIILGTALFILRKRRS